MKKIILLLEQIDIETMAISGLLKWLANGRKEIKCSFEKGNEFGEKKSSPYHQIGTRYAPIACEVFKRLWPRLDTDLAANLAGSTGWRPDSIEFWDDPDAITGIYEALEKDGHYPKIEPKENSYGST